MKILKLRLLALTIFVLILNNTFAQRVGVGTNTPDPSAELDVTSTDKGVLIPRVNIADLSTANPITNPATSLLVYNTNNTTGNGFYMWDGSKWVKLIDENTSIEDIDWREQGTGDIPNNINNNIYTGGNVSIGNVVAQERLHVNGNTFQQGLKVDINGNTIVGILPNDGQGNYNKYWNTIGGTAPTRIAAGVAYQEFMFSTASNSNSSNYRIRYGGYGAAGSAITWNEAFSLKYDNGFIGIQNNAPIYPLDVTGEITSRNANSFRLRRADYSVIHRNDNTNYYMLLTESGSPDGSWNAHRPFRIGLATGDVSLGKNNTLFVDQSEDKVGIGSGAPAEKLSVFNGHVSVSPEFGLVRGFGGASEYAYLPNAAGITSMAGIGPNAPIDYGTQIRSDLIVAFVETDQDKVSGWMDLNSNRFNWDGLISSTRVKVQTNVWADYVFKKDYQLKSLEETELFIQKNGHLPNIPNEETVVKEGFDVSEMTTLQQEKIEELFLHTIELNKQVKELIESNKALIETNKALENRINQLEEK